MTPKTSDRLVSRFGELMTFDELAKLLDRSPAGLRITISRQSSEFATALVGTRVKLGRRVYFRSHLVGQLIDACTGSHEA